MDIRIIFGQDPYELRWRVRDTDIARRWSAVLAQAVPFGIRESDRFYNFPNDGWSRSRIAAEMNEAMEEIAGQYGEVFDGMRASTEMSQAHFNALHTFFETLRGSIDEPADYFVNATPEVARAIERYNVLIHRWEDFTRSEGSLTRARFVCTFEQKFRTALEPEDYQGFTFAHDFGAMRINYCQIGKPLYDVYKDGDEVVGDEAIRPLRQYSADFNVSFSSVSQQGHDTFMAGFWEWFDRKSNYLSALGFRRTDPDLAVGYLTVADLVSTDSRETILDALSARQHIAAVVVEP